MTKYKWSLLGLIISTILFLVFLISPLINFFDKAIIPAEPMPEYLAEYLGIGSLGIGSYSNPLDKYIIGYTPEKEEAYNNWYKNVPKKISRSALNDLRKSFYNWNLFWIGIIVFSFLTFNYKKTNK